MNEHDDTCCSKCNGLGFKRAKIFKVHHLFPKKNATHESRLVIIKKWEELYPNSITYLLLPQRSQPRDRRQGKLGDWLPTRGGEKRMM
jgi:hypothetical protein